MRLFIRFELHVYLHKERRNMDAVRENGSSQGMRPSVFCQQIREKADKLKPSVSPSTSENYQMAIRSFQRFLDDEAPHGCVDNDLMKQYERWLRNRQICPNTISCYMRSLRSLAIKEYGRDMKEMFCDVYTGRTETEKRAIRESDIAKIQKTDLKSGSFLALVRDLFLFSFYALGMPFVDMAFLRKEQIADGQIVYYRHKTGQRISMKVEPCMQEIINRYQTQESCYVFPLLNSADPDKAYKQYQTKLNRYNRGLKQLAKVSGVTRKLTSYVARHSWASAAYRDNVDLPVISMALGHTNPQNTLIYLHQIDDQRLQDANHLLLSKLPK